MPRTVPTAYDLERFLIGAGMIGLTPTVREQYLDLDLAVDAAYEDFQNDTGIRPFLAESATTNKKYNFGGSYVQLPPYTAITRVSIRTPYETTSEAKTEVTDFEFVYDGDTIVGLQFAGFFRDGDGRLVIDGRRGWSDDLPANVFQAIQGRAAGVHLRPSIASAINNGAISWQEGDVSEKYGSMGAFSASAEGWEMQYLQAVNRYKRVQVYGAGRL